MNNGLSDAVERLRGELKSRHAIAMNNLTITTGEFARGTEYGLASAYDMALFLLNTFVVTEAQPVACDVCVCGHAAAVHNSGTWHCTTRCGCVGFIRAAESN